MKKYDPPQHKHCTLTYILTAVYIYVIWPINILHTRDTNIDLTLNQKSAYPLHSDFDLFDKFQIVDNLINWLVKETFLSSAWK